MTAENPRILLVEDEELNRTLVKAVLARAEIAAVREAEVLDAATPGRPPANGWAARTSTWSCWT